jgi:tetratricopeptide (TPR) repeat protein
MDARAAMAQEDWPVTLEKLQAVLALEPTNPEAAAQLREVRHAPDLHNLYTTGQKHYEAGRWQEALDCFRQIQERQTKRM